MGRILYNDIKSIVKDNAIAISNIQLLTDNEKKK